VTAIAFAVAGCRPHNTPATHAPLEFKGETTIAPQDNVRIGVRTDVSEVTISSESDLIAKEAKSGTLERWPAKSRHFTVSKGILRIGEKAVSGSWRLSPADAGATITVGNYFYRGTIIIKPTGDGKLTVINECDIDDYLKGVLPREAVPTWHEEALKAQAVASRTYLASHLARHTEHGYDLCSDVHCQVYGGATKEHPRCNAAVDATKGQILIFDGKPIGAFFSANCGGFTEGIQVVWGTPDRPYLRSRRCTWGTEARWYEWRLTTNNTEMMNALRAKGLVKGNELRSISVTKKGPSGRAATMAVLTDAGTFTMLGNDFRIALHPEKIRSTLFTKIAKLQGGYLFTGRGWGHGVGMCQWGAKGQAEQGKEYREILAYYYQETNLAIWSRQ